MVQFQASGGGLYCIDAYEASRGESDEAVSGPGAEPWEGLEPAEAEDACERAEVVVPERETLRKRLCCLSEWQAACDGENDWPYPYNEEYDAGACNGADRTTVVLPTGNLDTCEGAFTGLFDMSGNVREWTSVCDEERGHAYVGGSFEDPQYYLGCHDEDRRLWPNPSEEAIPPHIGFRCCLTIPLD